MKKVVIAAVCAVILLILAAAAFFLFGRPPAAEPAPPVENTPPVQTETVPPQPEEATQPETPAVVEMETEVEYVFTVRPLAAELLLTDGRRVCVFYGMPDREDRMDGEVWLEDAEGFLQQSFRQDIPLTADGRLELSGYADLVQETVYYMQTVQREQLMAELLQAEGSAELERLLQGFEPKQDGGSWDLWLEDLQTGVSAGRTIGAAPDGFVSASLIKLFIMAAVCEQVEQGTLQEQAVSGLLYNMITVSDNWSANELIRMLGGGDSKAGMAAVNAYAAGIGCEATKLQRLMLENNGLQNYTTAADCANLLRRIYLGQCVSPAWSEKMLEILKEQQLGNGILRITDAAQQVLPEGVEAASKTGDLSGLCFGDVGIVFTTGGDYLLCAIHNDTSVTLSDKQSLAELSLAVYQWFTREERMR